MATTPLALLRGMRRREQEQAVAHGTEPTAASATGGAAAPVPSLFGDVIGLVMRYLTIRDLLAVEIASRDAWLATVHCQGGGAWKTVRDEQFEWANSTAQFLLDVSASKKRGVLGLLREVTREVGLGSPAWDVYRRRQAAMRRFVARPCECMVGAIGRCDRPGCGREIPPEPQRCFHGPVPTEPHFDGRMRTYCSRECDVALHGAASSFAWSVPHLMRVLDRGSDVAIVHQFATAFGGFPRLVFLSLQQDLPRTRPRNLRRTVSLLVQHRPDVFPVRSWSLVGPQFVPMFDDLQGIEGSWSLQETFRKHLRWYETIDELQKLTVEKAQDLRPLVLDYCRVPAGVATGAVADQAKLRVHSVQYPVGVDPSRGRSRHLTRSHSSSPRSGGGGGGGGGSHAGGRLGVFARPTLVLLSANGPVMHQQPSPGSSRVQLLRSRSHRLQRRAESGAGDDSDSGGVDGTSSDGGWGDGRRRAGRRQPMSPLAARSVTARGSRGGRSPLTALSVTPRSRTMLVRTDSGGSDGASWVSGAGSDADAAVDVTLTLGGGSGGGGGRSSRPRTGGGGSRAARGRAPWSVSVTPLHRTGSGSSVGSAGSGGNMLGGAGPRRDTRVVATEPQLQAGDGTARGLASAGSTLLHVGAGQRADTTRSQSPAACESHVDAALVRFLDALIKHGGIACVTAWRWLSDAEEALRGGGDDAGTGALRGGMLTAALVRCFTENNGLALLCSAIDCPQPANTSQAAVVMGSLLRAVGCVRIAHGRMDVSLTGSPLVTVWCQRAGITGTSTCSQPSARLSKVPAGMVPLSFSPRGSRGHTRASSAGSPASRHRRAVARTRTWEQLEW